MTLPHALPAPAGDFSCPLALVAPDECARIGDLLDQSLSDRTRAVYRSAWARFADWYLKRGTPSLPAAPVVLAAYFSYLFNDLGRTVTTVRLQRSAITSVHRLSGYPDPAADPGVVRLLAGISRFRAWHHPGSTCGHPGRMDISIKSQTASAISWRPSARGWRQG